MTPTAARKSVSSLPYQNLIMSEYADKSKENKGIVVNGQVTQRKTGQTSQLVDNRPQAVAQRKMQEAINNSPRIQQLKANNIFGVAQLQENSLNTTSQPLQKKTKLYRLTG